MLINEIKIYKAAPGERLADKLESLFQEWKGSKKLAGLRIFVNATDSVEYAEVYILCKRLGDKYWGEKCPPLSIISQKCLDASFSVERMYVSDEVSLSVKSFEGITYSVMQSGYRREIYAGGYNEHFQDSLERQSYHAFEIMKRLLLSEQMSVGHIVRQWNYLANITGMDGAQQRYQIFNDVRSDYYDCEIWNDGLPAATGIGMQSGGLLVEFLAVDGDFEIQAVSNPQQLDAHIYTQEVLIGENSKNKTEKCTPKFERAKLLQGDEQSELLVSGTAAIKGEESLFIGDVEGQTELTLDNIELLVKEGFKKDTIDRAALKIKHLRAYVKRAEDVDEVIKTCVKRYPEVEVVYVLADICREELLVEIEGVVSTSDCLESINN